MTGIVFPLLLIGVLVIGTAAVIVVAHANGGEHVWHQGNAWAIPTGDRAHATRHAWRPGASSDTIRVNDLVRRLADEAALAARSGRHRLIGDDPADGDEGQADDEGQQLFIHELLAA